MSAEEKVQLKIYIRRRLLEELRQVINLKYARYERGLLSHEVEQALGHWLSLHTKAQKSLVSSRINPTPKVAKVFAQVKQYLLTKYYDELRPGSQVIYQHLREAIANVRGADERTIEKWIGRFVENKLIKHIAGAIWEVA